MAWSGQLQNVKIVRSSDDGQEQLLGTGYELEREQETTINGLTQTWTERVFLIRSFSYLKKQKRGLETRLETARKKLHLLSLAVRILTLIEFVVRRSLQESGESLLGLYSGNPKWIVFNILSILF